MAFAMPRGSSSRSNSATSSSRAADLLRETNDRRRAAFGSRRLDPAQTETLSRPTSSTGRPQSGSRSSSVPAQPARESEDTFSVAAARMRLKDQQEKVTTAPTRSRQRPHSAPSGGNASQRLPAKPRTDCLFPRYDGGKLPSQLSTPKLVQQIAEFHKGEVVPDSRMPSPPLDAVEKISACGYSGHLEAAFQDKSASQCSSAAPVAEKKLKYYAPYHTSLVSSMQSGGLLALINDPSYINSKRDPGLIQRNLRYNIACDPGVCVSRQAKFPDVIGDKPSGFEITMGMGAAACAAQIRELEALRAQRWPSHGRGGQ